MKSLQFSLYEKLAFYFHGGRAFIFISFVVLGPVLFQLGGGKDIFVEMKFEYGELGFARGYLVEVLDTDETKYDEPVFQYNYSFPIGLETVYGTSFSSEFYFEPGQRVQIEYLKEAPQVSRMYGAYFADFMLLSYLGIGLFVVGLISIPIRLYTIKGIQRFLQTGSIVIAKYEGLAPTGLALDDGSEFRINYQYSVGDKSYYVSRRTTDPHGKNTDMILVYSNADPTDVTFLSELPAAVSRKMEQTVKLT